MDKKRSSRLSQTTPLKGSASFQFFYLEPEYGGECKP
jgi:hypothetical protein